MEISIWLAQVAQSKHNNIISLTLQIGVKHKDWRLNIVSIMFKYHNGLAMTNQHHEHHVEYSTHPMQCLGSNSWENPTHISPGFRLTVSAIARGSDDAEIWTKQWPSFSEYHGGENQTAMDNNNVSWKSCIKYTYITTIYIYCSLGDLCCLYAL